MEGLDLSDPRERFAARQAASSPDRTLLADLLLAALDLLDRIPADVLDYAARWIEEDRRAVRAAVAEAKRGEPKGEV